jgi:nitrite reductase/ring-hydroxylating ferredoxin subunit
MSASDSAPVLLCDLGDIPEGRAKSFWLGADTARRGIVVIRRGAQVVGYVNACPHIGTPLNFLGDRFLDASGELILCGTHGALFRIDDGFCIHGPCIGGRLTPVRTITIASQIFLMP